MSVDYRSAGVDIAAGNEAVERIKDKVASTFSPSVLTGLGSFASLYDLGSVVKAYQQPVMVQSIDGVGTKIIVARMMNKFDDIGADLVSATANDIVVVGAKPLTLLDYIANDRLKPQVIEQIVAGMARACKSCGISLVGGETAEMPNTYLPGEHDLVGCVTGVVERDGIITGKSIVSGDKVYAFASSGMHTNGFSLARKLLFDVAGYDVETEPDELARSIGEELLIPHVNYTNAVHALLESQVEIKGMAHITGGGLLENIPRVLPENCAVEIDKNAWPQLPLFSMLTDIGKLNPNEAYRTFNMGVGLVMIVNDQFEKELMAFEQLPVYKIGEVVPHQGQGQVTIK